jgi:hypothetical protein
VTQILTDPSPAKTVSPPVPAPGAPNPAAGAVGVTVASIGALIAAIALSTHGQDWAIGVGVGVGGVLAVAGAALYFFTDARPTVQTERRSTPSARFPFCPYCGRPRRPTGEFCHVCGQRS